jgi:predicted transposase/invertase (TIGR01784 family)
MEPVLAEIIKSVVGYDLFTAVLWYNVINIPEQDQDELSQVLARITNKDTEVIMGSLAEKWLNQGIEQGVQLGMQQGMQQGVQQGVQQGAHQKELEIATKLLIKGNSVSDVADITGLSFEEIQQVNRGLKN